MRATIPAPTNASTNPENMILPCSLTSQSIGTGGLSSKYSKQSSNSPASTVASKYAVPKIPRIIKPAKNNENKGSTFTITLPIKKK